MRTQSSSHLEHVDLGRLPQHIAFIMDGNGRWANKQGMPRSFGHSKALHALRSLLEAVVDLHIPYLTLYAFSQENWQRPAEEVQVLMDLMRQALDAREEELVQHNVCLRVFGDMAQVPQDCARTLARVQERTAQATGLQLGLALSYSGHWEMAEAVRRILQHVQEGGLDAASVQQETVRAHLASKHLPDVDLLIRTSGEMRLSNFLPWQLAYAELYFTPVLFPDFTRENLYEALVHYQQRSRRFGRLETTDTPRSL